MRLEKLPRGDVAPSTSYPASAAASGNVMQCPYRLV